MTSSHNNPTPRFTTTTSSPPSSQTLSLDDRQKAYTERFATIGQDLVKQLEYYDNHVSYFHRGAPVVLVPEPPSPRRPITNAELGIHEEEVSTNAEGGPSPTNLPQLLGHTHQNTSPQQPADTTQSHTQTQALAHQSPLPSSDDTARARGRLTAASSSSHLLPLPSPRPSTSTISNLAQSPKIIYSISYNDRLRGRVTLTQGLPTIEPRGSADWTIKPGEIVVGELGEYEEEGGEAEEAPADQTHLPSSPPPSHRTNISAITISSPPRPTLTPEPEPDRLDPPPLSNEPITQAQLAAAAEIRRQGRLEKRKHREESGNGGDWPWRIPRRPIPEDARYMYYNAVGPRSGDKEVEKNSFQEQLPPRPQHRQQQQSHSEHQGHSHSEQQQQQNCEQHLLRQGDTDSDKPEERYIDEPQPHQGQGQQEQEPQPQPQPEDQRREEILAKTTESDDTCDRLSGMGNEVQQQQQIQGEDRQQDLPQVCNDEPASRYTDQQRREQQQGRARGQKKEEQGPDIDPIESSLDQQYQHDHSSLTPTVEPEVWYTNQQPEQEKQQKKQPADDPTDSPPDQQREHSAAGPRSEPDAYYYIHPQQHRSESDVTQSIPDQQQEPPPPAPTSKPELYSTDQQQQPEDDPTEASPDPRAEHAFSIPTPEPEVWYANQQQQEQISESEVYSTDQQQQEQRQEQQLEDYLSSPDQQQAHSLLTPTPEFERIRDYTLEEESEQEEEQQQQQTLEEELQQEEEQQQQQEREREQEQQSETEYPSSDIADQRHRRSSTDEHQEPTPLSPIPTESPPDEQTAPPSPTSTQHSQNLDAELAAVIPDSNPSYYKRINQPPPGLSNSEVEYWHRLSLAQQQDKRSLDAQGVQMSFRGYWENLKDMEERRSGGEDEENYWHLSYIRNLFK
ncbi:MAG: hypothetical protein L6R40_008002 [Gallowayella cf. fulva]|nr:MAG: hypothetical protein L6R40_008002 [Xanthomendoza cf. fulva]